jgi:endonuclease III
MRARAANAFLLGVMFDRSVSADRAWDAAQWICDAVGESDDVGALWRALRDMDPRRLRGFLRYGYGGCAFHRHYKTFARLLPQAAHHLLAHYGGDPRRIWGGQRDVTEVRRRLDAIPAIGPALAKMAVLILAREHGLLGGKKASPQLDVKPDVHVRRVFLRTGLIPHGASIEAVLQSARQVAPDFPASLDAPAWEIGRNWCRPQRPKCPECPLDEVCPRVGLRH